MKISKINGLRIKKQLGITCMNHNEGNGRILLMTCEGNYVSFEIDKFKVYRTAHVNGSKTAGGRIAIEGAPNKTQVHKITFDRDRPVIADLKILQEYIGSKNFGKDTK